MAQVWEATDQTLARRVAVKILHPHLARDDAFVRRFRAEAVAAARLAHPSIVSVYDTVEDDGLNAIVMELVRGTTMRADLDQHGPMQLAAVLAIGSQVADALGAAHAGGLVHRDVKPANILLSSDGRVLVADFGIAKAAQGADLTSDGSMVGTAKYLAPEQVEGRPVDARTDLYALGVVLYEALTGEAPFRAETDTGTALARLHRDPTPVRQLRPEIPASVEDVVSQAMARQPEHRFANATAMRRALLEAGADPTKAPAVAQAAVAADTGERPVTSPAPSRPPPPRPPARSDQRPAVAPGPDPAVHGARPGRRWWRWVALAVVLVLVAGGVVLWVGQRSSPIGSPLPISLSTFDPVANDGENNGQLGLINDDDPATSWRTERYSTADLNGKGGTGLVMTVATAQELGRLDLTTPERGWVADVYLVDGPIPVVDLAEWGPPVARIDGEPGGEGTIEVDLGGRRATSVLVWFTRLLPDGSRFSARIATIALRAP